MSGRETGGVNFGGAMKRITFAVCLTLVLLAVSAGAGCGGDAAQGSGSDGLSAKMQTYVDKAMPKLEKIVQKWRNGDQAGAAKLWESIGDAPTSTEADYVVSKDYLEYANNVRYYVIGGGATLKDVEKSRAKAEATLADLR